MNVGQAMMVPRTRDLGLEGNLLSPLPLQYDGVDWRSLLSFAWKGCSTVGAVPMLSVVILGVAVLGC